MTQYWSLCTKNLSFTCILWVISELIVGKENSSTPSGSIDSWGRLFRVTEATALSHLIPRCFFPCVLFSASFFLLFFFLTLLRSCCSHSIIYPEWPHMQCPLFVCWRYWIRFPAEIFLFVASICTVQLGLRGYLHVNVGR